MCLVIALWLWYKYGGRLVIVFQPFPHAVVCSVSGIRHGTNRGGKWHVEEMTNAAFSRWLDITKQ